MLPPLMIPLNLLENRWQKKMARSLAILIISSSLLPSGGCLLNGQLLAPLDYGWGIKVLSATPVSKLISLTPFEKRRKQKSQKKGNNWRERKQGRGKKPDLSLGMSHALSTILKLQKIRMYGHLLRQQDFSLNLG